MIRQARLEAGLSQRELAGRLGVSASAVAKLETQASPPSVSTLERVAKALGKKLAIAFVD